MKQKMMLMMGVAGCFAGLAIVHALSYISAITDKQHHFTNREAMWDAVFYDFLIGIPVAGLCGWLVVATIARRTKSEPEGVVESNGGEGE